MTKQEIEQKFGAMEKKYEKLEKRVESLEKAFTQILEDFQLDKKINVAVEKPFDGLIG